ncbi:MAG: kinase [Caulobacter sp.]|nr:kinase [Caulobacter sp.]
MIDTALTDLIVDLAAARARPDRPPLIGVSGSQGSGKTTLAAAVARRINAAAFSLDDVYLTQAERRTLAAAAHPLFLVRGPPGTHDLDLADRTVAALRAARDGDETPLPRFDKLRDERAPEGEWPVFRGRPEAVVIDGWCLGALSQDAATLAASINDLERDADPHAIWRSYADQQLAGRYQAFFAGFDAIVFLAAPAFETVLDWRCEQEAGLLGVTPDQLPDGRRAELARFIQHFERITRHMLDGGVRADVLVRLDDRRRTLAIETPGEHEKGAALAAPIPR